MPDTTITSSTFSINHSPYDDLTTDFLRWVWKAPLESDAVENIRILLRQYDRRKTFKQRLLAFFA